MKRFIPVVVGVFLLVGCASFNASQSDKKGKVQNSSVSKNIKIFYDGKPSQSYRAVGTVSVDKSFSPVPLPKSDARIVEELKEKAAALGADALMKWNDTGFTISAVAVKYVK